MRAIISATVGTMLAIASGPALAVTVGLPMTVTDETGWVTKPKGPDTVQGLPETRIPTKREERHKRGPAPRVVPSGQEAVPSGQKAVPSPQKRVSAASNLPAALRRLLPDLLPLVDRHRPAKSATTPAMKDGPVPGATRQLDVFGADVGRPGPSEQMGAFEVGKSPAPKIPTKGKRWVPERTLPRVGPPVLAQPPSKPTAMIW